MHVDAAVIDRSPEEGTRRVVLALLRACDDAARRLAHQDDGEALHDFRVGLRRLRTALRSFAPWLGGSVRRRDPKRLGKLAKASNAARDAEVHLAFLASQQAGGTARHHRAGHAFLRERLEARRRDGLDVDGLVGRYRRLSRQLSDRVPRFEIRLDDTAPGGTFAAALAAVVTEQLEAVRGRVSGIAGPGDEERVHKTRIAVKRLRYLLEPLRGNPHADARGAVRELKRLQDVLGDLHDAHTLSRELEAALLDASAEHARHLFAAVYDAGASGAALRDALRGGPRAGVLALARAVRQRRDALFAELERTWLAGGLDALAAEVGHITAALEHRAGERLEAAPAEAEAEAVPAPRGRPGDGEVAPPLTH